MSTPKIALQFKLKKYHISHESATIFLMCSAVSNMSVVDAECKWDFSIY
jgi:hypothetical protein